MAKKQKADRQDPHSNKSLAIRLTLEKMPAAKASEVAAAVLTNYGHKVKPTLIYLVKSKANLRSDRRSRKSGQRGVKAPMNSAATWTAAIRSAQHLLKATGSVANATAVLRAVDG